MYPLPVNFDGAMFLSKTVESVSFDQFQVSLEFSGSTFLMIEGGYQYRSGDIAERQHPGRDGVAPSHLPEIVGDTVDELLFEQASGDLVLSFKKGAVLVVFGDAGPYEAYSIRSAGQHIIV